MRRLSPVLALSLLATAGCAGGTDSSDVATEGQDRPTLTAVASVYPLAWLGEQIAPDTEVELLVAGGQEAHDIDLTPQQRAAVESADVVLYTGDIDYQPQVEQAVESANGAVVAAAEIAGPDALLAAAEDAHDDHEGEEKGEESAAPAAAAGAEQAGVDPHLWFDADILSELATATGEAFAEADPDGAAEYRERATEVAAQMAALGTELDGVLGGDCRFDEAIVSHAAYGYLLGPYELEQHAVTNVSAEGDASAGELAEIVGEIREEGFTHVLTEPVEGREGAETVAREAGVELLEISPLDAVTDEQAERGFPELVMEQAKAFGTALGCS